MPIEIQVTASQALHIIGCGREVGYSFHECEKLIRSGKTEKEILEIFNKTLNWRKNPKPKLKVYK